jgi:N utilization substance protein A
MNQDLLRIVDSISRDKNIDKEEIFMDIEASLLSAARKFYGEADDVACTIDRMTGEIEVRKGETLIDYREFGRIAAQTAKQVLIQKIRENERTSILDEFQEQKGQIVTGSVSRFEGNALIVNIGRTEGFLPKSEQIPGETHNTGERIRCLLLDVRDAGSQVKLILSRSHPDFIRRLFEVEVPEVQEKVIEIKALAREAGYRTKIAVTSIDTKVDAVGACVGVRGSRIKNIVDELGGEKIDIVRWNDSSQILITNALKPAEIVETSLNFELNRATVVVNEDQLSLAIGKRGQNVRLAARLTGWDIDILTPKEYNKGLEDMEKSLKPLEGVDEGLLDRMVALGIINLLDIEEIGAEPLVKELQLAKELADKIVAVAAEDAKRIAAEDAARRAAEEEAKKGQVSPLDAALAAPAPATSGLSPLAALEAAPAPPPIEPEPTETPASAPAPEAQAASTPASAPGPAAAPAPSPEQTAPPENKPEANG